MRIAVSGNPNAGKTTLFNTLTGGRARVGNYPGVTVESRTGAWTPAGETTPHEVVDIPGTYSLMARSPEEEVAIRTIRGVAGIGAPPDVVLDVVDATNLDRNLYLTLQLLELGRPVVVVLSMIDLMEAEGGSVDWEVLEARLGVPVVDGRRGDPETPRRVAEGIARALALPPETWTRRWRCADGALEEGLASLAGWLVQQGHASARDADGLAVWLAAQASEARGDEGVPIHTDAAVAARVRALVPAGAPDESGLLDAMIRARYAWIADTTRGLVTRSATGLTRSDRIDRVVTHRVVGPMLFVAVMALVFQLMFAWSDPLIGAIEDVFGAINDGLRSTLPAGPLTDLLTEGVVSGVGNVLVFLPQIAILFTLLALLDASGYLARAAFLMDRIMSRVGLHGKAFVPLLTSFACAVPGIAVTRTIESRNDRLVTILVAPLMTCSARLPVYVLLIGAFFSSEDRVGPFTTGGLVLLALYFGGILAALAVAAVLKRTLLKAPRPPLLLELPPWHVPRARDVWADVRERCLIFIRDAGTVILAATVLLWGVMTWPGSPEVEAAWDARIASAESAAPAPDAPEEVATAHAATIEALRWERDAAVLDGTIAGRVASFVAPVVEPLGFNPRITIGLIAALSAREVMVSALGVSYGIGGDVDESSDGLRDRLRRDPSMNRAVAISLLVWFVLAFQCVATLGAVHRETASWRWPAFLVAYQTVLAWVGAFVAYRVALLIFP